MRRVGPLLFRPSGVSSGKHQEGHAVFHSFLLYKNHIIQQKISQLLPNLTYNGQNHHIHPSIILIMEEIYIQRLIKTTTRSLLKRVYTYIYLSINISINLYTCIINIVIITIDLCSFSS